MGGPAADALLAVIAKEAATNATTPHFKPRLLLPTAFPLQEIIECSERYRTIAKLLMAVRRATLALPRDERVAVLWSRFRTRQFRRLRLLVRDRELVGAEILNEHVSLVLLESAFWPRPSCENSPREYGSTASGSRMSEPKIEVNQSGS